MTDQAQKEVEIILARQLASYLATPIFIVDPMGTLLYYNEPAEVILGRRFSESGEMTIAEWTTMFSPVNAEGMPLKPEVLPLVASLRDGRPSHGALTIRAMDNVVRRIEVTAFPLLGQAGRFVGAVALFWEVPQE